MQDFSHRRVDRTKDGHRKPCLPSLSGVTLSEDKYTPFEWRFAKRLTRYQCWPGNVCHGKTMNQSNRSMEPNLEVKILSTRSMLRPPVVSCLIMAVGRFPRVLPGSCKLNLAVEFAEEGFNAYTCRFRVERIRESRLATRSCSDNPSLGERSEHTEVRSVDVGEARPASSRGEGLVIPTMRLKATSLETCLARYVPVLH